MCIYVDIYYIPSVTVRNVFHERHYNFFPLSEVESCGVVCEGYVRGGLFTLEREKNHIFRLKKLNLKL